MIQNPRPNAIATVHTDWRLVFRGVKGADTDMYAAFIDGTNAVTDDITCMSLDDTSCSSHFRSRVIDNWSYALYTRVNGLYHCVVIYLYSSGFMNCTLFWYEFCLCVNGVA